MENNMELFSRLLIEILSGITYVGSDCYPCPLCKLTGIKNACESPDKLIAFVKEADPLVIENLIKEVSY